MNKITIYGRLSKDIELKTLQNGTSVASISVASNGRKKEETNFFECKAFSGLADTMAKYLHKGDPIVAYGTMHQYSYTKQDGTTVKDNWEVLIEDIDFVPTGKKQEQAKAVEVAPEQVGKLPF